jgi:uncharacterized membrane protein
MDNFISLDMLFRWSHVLFGITWIGLLYYFNFIQGEYFKEAEPEAKADALKKLAPRALWWFRWGAMFTFLTGAVLLVLIYGMHGIDGYITVGATLGTLMFLNVWLIIWPAQKIVCGLIEGEAGVAGPKALLASRTNTLFSAPMLIGMMGSYHGGGQAGDIVMAANAPGGLGVGLIVALLLIAGLEGNAIFGKTGPMTSVNGVITSSLVLTVVFLGLLQFF